MPANLLNFDHQIIGFVLVFFRVAGLMLFAPLFGSARLPRRFKVLIALVMTPPMVLNGIPPSIAMPDSLGMLTIGLAGELAFGLILGMVISLVFVAAQWAGEMVGQQIGLNMAEVLDPALGGGGSIIGDLYFMVATAAFLFIGGHRILVLAIYESLTTCPPLTVFFHEGILDYVRTYLLATTVLAMRIAAPTFATMVIVDVSMGCISKTMPQLNVMSAGMAVRGMLGMVVLMMGVNAVGRAISIALANHMDDVTQNFINPAPH